MNTGVKVKDKLLVGGTPVGMMQYIDVDFEWIKSKKAGDKTISNEKNNKINLFDFSRIFLNLCSIYKLLLNHLRSQTLK